MSPQPERRVSSVELETGGIDDKWSDYPKRHDVMLDLRDARAEIDTLQAAVRELRAALSVAENLMRNANDASESDATRDERRASFAAIQDYFDPAELHGYGDVLARTDKLLPEDE